MMYCTTQDISTLFRPLTQSETTRASALIPIVESRLHAEAHKVGTTLEILMENGDLDENILKAIICDIVGRTLSQSTTGEAMTQTTQSALGYSVTGTPLNPGGGIFIKKSELRALGIRRQRMGMINLCP